jgi:hypothetical protein
MSRILAGDNRREHEDAPRHARSRGADDDPIVLDPDEVAVGLVRQGRRRLEVVDPEERRSQVTLAHPHVGDAALYGPLAVEPAQ